MSTEFQKEGFVVGRELPDGSLDLYSQEHARGNSPYVSGLPGLTPMQYLSQEEALRAGDLLNHFKLEGGNWQVYRMRLEEVEATEPVPLKSG